MVNKRRRRTVIVVVTVVFVVVMQLPNLFNLYHTTHRPFDDKRAELGKVRQVEIDKIREAIAAKTVEPEEAKQRLDKLQQELSAEKEKSQHQRAEATYWGRLINAVLPLGWLPLGAMAAAEGDILPAVLGMFGLTLLGTASLWRSYHTTVRLYTGQFTAGKLRQRTEQPAIRPPKPEKQSAGMLEKTIPCVSEHASAIALAGIRSLTRAPEAKMMFMTPVIILLVFGSMFLTQSVNMPLALRPLLAFGGMATVLLGMLQLIGNQFAFDRSGFRVFVLCAANRRDILLGKNLSFAPLALSLALIMAILVQILYPMRFDHFLASLPQMVSMYLTLCFMGNWLSMLAPMPIASGSLKPSNPRLVPILLQLLFFFILPMILSPLLLPLGIELAVQYLGGIEGLPIYLVLALVECAAVVCIYGLLLGWQGSTLHAREQRILEIVTKAE
jgi:hypothetical protein